MFSICQPLCEIRRDVAQTQWDRQVPIEVRSEADRRHRTTITAQLAVADPFAGWLLLRGLRTLALRVQRQNRTALSIAEFLAEHAKVG